jgi:peptide-methionine (R)-S-oxide reductase
MAADYSVKKTDAEWKKELDPLQHHVLRDHGTERPFTSPLNAEKRTGTFRCAGCGEPLLTPRPSTKAARDGPRSGRRRKAQSASRPTPAIS